MSLENPAEIETVRVSYAFGYLRYGAPAGLQQLFRAADTVFGQIADRTHSRVPFKQIGKAAPSQAKL